MLNHFYPEIHPGKLKVLLKLKKTDHTPTHTKKTFLRLFKDAARTKVLLETFNESDILLENANYFLPVRSVPGFF